MHNQILSFINYEYSDFKNTMLVYFFDDDVKEFTAQNNVIQNIAQIKEFQIILERCKEFEFQLSNTGLEKIKTNLDFLYKMIVCEYKTLNYFETIHSCISKISLEVFMSHKAWFLSNKNQFSQAIANLKDIEGNQNRNEVLKNILIVINGYSKIDNLKIINEIEKVVDIFKYSDRLINLLDF